MNIRDGSVGQRELGTMRVLAGLAATDVGEADERPPLVLLHGLTFDRSLWGPSLVELARADPGRRALAFDLPGHGASSAWDSYDVESVAAGVHRAVVEAGLERPVIVGHSLAAIVASVYAGAFPTRGVVNVDQPLQTAPFASFLHSIADQLRGDEFGALWNGFAASMHPELLPAAAQELVRVTSRPQQDLVLGYWREVLDQPVVELVERIAAGLAALRGGAVRYLLVVGNDLTDEYRSWLEQELPQAEVTVLAGSGHFPQLAHPGAFASLLAATGRWGSEGS
jgi:pimeloyl-ACP methyl ester carboxylesterase